MNFSLAPAYTNGKTILLKNTESTHSYGKNKPKTQKKGGSVSPVKKMALIGVFSAFAFVLTLLSNLIPISVAGFLSYDPKDIIVAIAGFILGPSSALIISVITGILELSISSTGIIGCIMNIISTAAFAGVSSLIYKKNRSIKGAIFGLIIACLVTTGLMIAWNAFVTPYYMHVPRETVYSMLLPVFLPFNLIKTGINATLTILIYKPIVKALRKIKIIKESERATPSKSNLGVILVSVFILVSLIFAFLIISKVI